MKLSALILGAATAVTMMPGASAYPWMDPDLSDHERRQLLSGLTSMLGGGGGGGGGLLGGLLGGGGGGSGGNSGGSNANFLTGLFAADGNAAGGQGKVGLGDLMNAFKGLTRTWNPADIQRMTEAFNEGASEVIRRAEANPKFGGWPKNPFMDKTAADITPQMLYDAYGLWRGDGCGDLRPWGRNQTGPTADFSSRKTPFREDLTLENCDWGIWGPAENKDHPYQPPPEGAMRGPCPGLNTIANYGYIPRNGVATIQELFVGVWEGLSIAPDLSSLLIMAGIIFKGDMKTLTVSIGGAVPNAGVGIREHGILEGDASVTRKDLKLGNNWKVDPGLLDQYKQEIVQYGNGDVTPKVQAMSRLRAYTNSKENNSGFDFNPLRAIVAYAESGFAMEVFRGQNSLQTPIDIDHWFMQDKFPPNWSRRNVPMTAAEIITWGMLFYKEAPTNPGMNFGFGFTNFPASFNWLGSGTVNSNGCNFEGFIKTLLPNGFSAIEGSPALGGLEDFKCN